MSKNITELDTLLELHRNEHFATWKDEEELQKYQSLYEKLKKAEDFYDYYYHNCGTYGCIKCDELRKQNQKTPEDIEKIKKYDELIKYLTPEQQQTFMRELVNADINNAVKLKVIRDLQQENQQLKESLSANLNHLEAEIKQHSVIATKYFKLLEDSKTNAEIVEKIKEINILDYIISNNEIDDYSVNDKLTLEKWNNKLQSILKEVKQNELG